MEENLAVFIASTLRLAMPLILASSGELVSERAGVLNLSLEGMMLTAAFFGAFGSWASGSPMFGVLCAVVASTAVSAVQALLSVRLRANARHRTPARLPKDFCGTWVSSPRKSDRRVRRTSRQLN